MKEKIDKSIFEIPKINEDKNEINKEVKTLSIVLSVKYLKTPKPLSN